ncbi:hypothetical protein TWF281_009870 [Arthrobotrys megalospora]
MRLVPPSNSANRIVQTNECLDPANWAPYFVIGSYKKIDCLPGDFSSKASGARPPWDPGTDHQLAHNPNDSSQQTDIISTTG